MVSKMNGSVSHPSTTEPKSNLLPDINPSALLHRSLQEPPEKVLYARGINLYLENGRTVLDGCGGAAVSCIGHDNAEVLEATIAQMGQLSYVHTLTYTTTAAEDLAHFLLDDNTFGLEKAYFVGSGSEAMDAALKLARQYWYEQGRTERVHFVARRQAYHGNTVGAMSVSSNLPRKQPYNGVLQLPHVSWVAPAYHYQYSQPGETEDAYAARLVAELDAHFQSVGPENIIAFIAEPLVGATSGCTPAPRGYFQGVREVCDRYGILLILDEVMCGTGRTGTMFAFEQEHITPDLVTMGKGLGGGYCPIAAVLVARKVVDVLCRGSASFNHGHTYQAHPVSCATALAVQKILRHDRLIQHCAEVGHYLHQQLLDMLSPLNVVGDVRGRGLFWGVEFVVDKRRTTGPFPPHHRFGPRVQRRAFELGVAVYPGAGTVDGTYGDHVIVAPPYNVTEEQCRTIVGVLRQAINEVEAEVRLEMDQEKNSS